MSIDLDTFLVAVYVSIDDLYQTYAAPHKPSRPGPKPTVSDSEVLTLVICRHWLGYTERALGRVAAAHWRSYFPRLLSQSAFNQRARDLCGVLVQLVPIVAAELAAQLRPYQVLDGLPVPWRAAVGASTTACSATKPASAKAAVTVTGTLVASSGWPSPMTGVITGFVLAPASCEGR